MNSPNTVTGVFGELFAKLKIQQLAGSAGDLDQLYNTIRGWFSVPRILQIYD